MFIKLANLTLYPTIAITIATTTLSLTPWLQSDSGASIYQLLRELPITAAIIFIFLKMSERHKQDIDQINTHYTETLDQINQHYTASINQTVETIISLSQREQAERDKLLEIIIKQLETIDKFEPQIKPN